MDSILRTWTFWIHPALQDECRDDLEVFVLKQMRQACGNQRASALFRDVGDGTLEVVVLSIWDSIEKIEEFAGPDYFQPTISSSHQAKVFDCEPTVRHYPLSEAPLWLVKATSI